MEHFKMQARNILGPAKKSAIRVEGLFDEEDYLDELYGNSSEHQDAYLYVNAEGKTVMVNKEYRHSMDIVTAYKSLKQAVSKAGNTGYTTTARDV
jgi:hypothetical protein